MLDLSIEDTTKLYEIKLADGRILKLKRPTQALQTILLQIYKNGGKLDEAVLVEVLFTTFAKILNRNTEGIFFDEKDLGEIYGIEVAGLVIKDYFTYYNEAVNKVDFQ